MIRKLTAVAALALGAASVQADNLPVAAVNVTGTVSGAAATLLLDGDFGVDTLWNSAGNVSWIGQAGAAGATFTFDFGGSVLLSDVHIGHDNNDLYAVQVSQDGAAWNTLFLSLPGSIDGDFEGDGGSIIRRSSMSGDPAYSALIDYPPAQASFARVYALSGDGLYSLSEMQFIGAPVPEPGALAVLMAGLMTLGAKLRRRRD
jgi:hypothetical protein